MQVRISSRNVEIEPELDELIREKIDRLSRFVDGLDLAEVHFSEDRHHKKSSRKDLCEVTVSGGGHHVRCKVEGRDPFVAFDASYSKLERQLRKLKTRRINHSHGQGETIRNGEVPTTEGNEPQPSIVKSKRFVLVELTPDDAILQMELLGHDFFFFINANSGDRAIVYARDDGDIGLIEEAT